VNKIPHLLFRTPNEKILAKAKSRQGEEDKTMIALPPFQASKKIPLRLHAFARNLPSKSPTNNLSELEHPPIQKNVEIFNSVEQKILPLHAQLPQNQQKPHQQRSNTEHPNPKNVHFSKFAHQKLLPLQLTTGH
jgi:hypothetical protein